ncbi:serine hydrolase [Winogradskyella sp. 3972H.M.0a.05]|uniref:serine hydrolase domain-containing protein n=1 Tax=Winogradskyella sp. 3972H.M.0a.05 TaxID=2950277 RepID=UPI003399C2DE
MKPKVNYLLVILATLLITGACNNSSLDDKKVEQLNSLMHYVDSTDMFSGAILITKNKQVVFDNYYGFSDMSEMTKNTQTIKYSLESLTKPITATVIFQLIEEGKLTLDSKLNALLLDFPYDEIKIKHLLNHTSGLVDYAFVADKSWSTDTDNLSNNDVINYLKSKAPALKFNPGSEWNYCNTNYAVLSNVAEKVSGKKWDELIKNRFFKDYEFDTSEIDFANFDKTDIAIGHSFDFLKGKYVPVYEKDRLKRDFFLNGVDGARGLYLSPSKFNDWFLKLMNGDFVSKESLQLMETINHDKGQYGYGWQISTDSLFGKTIYHHGAGNGYKNRFYSFPEKSLNISIFSNIGEEYTDSILLAIINIMKNKPYELPKKSAVQFIATDTENNIQNKLSTLKERKTSYYFKDQEIKNLVFSYWYLGESNKAVKLLKGFTDILPEKTELRDIYNQMVAAIDSQ